MKIFTSYFYQIRFFSPEMLPVSAAAFDPKWYHKFESSDTLFVDKNGVINGVRYPVLAPNSKVVHLCNGRNNCASVSDMCAFKTEYRKQLEALDFESVYKALESLANAIKDNASSDIEPLVVLMFYETPDNPCSERGIVQKWFADHGYPVKELAYPI